MSNPRQHGAVLTVVAVIVVVLIAAFLILTTVATIKSSAVGKRWDATIGTMQEVFERYPRTEPNAAALELERLTARIGIDTATRSDPDRVRPTEEQGAAYAALRKDLEATPMVYVAAMLERPQRGLDAPPARLAAFLDEHRRELDAIRDHLVSAGPLVWERDLTALAEAPIPNLLGSINLSKLLVADALALAWAGDREGALANLEATWNLAAAIRDEPILIDQLIVLAETRMVIGALRQIDDVPDVWRERLFEHDFRESFTRALAFEGWIWTQLDDASEFTQLSDIANKLISTVGKPYVQYCLADVSDEYRQRLVNLDAVTAICDYDLSSRQADLEVPVPRWNQIGGLVIPNLSGALDRLARHELDLELTARVLDLEHDRQTDASARASSACPRDRWIYGTTPQGSLTIALDRDVTWDDQRGPILPTRFTLQ